MEGPLDQAIKLNFDDCGLTNSGPSGISGIFRDAHGTCIQSFSGPLGVGDVITAETKALLHGLRLVLSMGLHHLSLEMEGDEAA